MWTKSLLQYEANIQTWRFMWKFPFIKIVNITGTIEDMQKIRNRILNQALDNRQMVIMPLYADNQTENSS